MARKVIPSELASKVASSTSVLTAAATARHSTELDVLARNKVC